MFSQPNENVKLEWMYKGPHSSVDREEYLLGRSVDKTLEQITSEDKAKETGALQPPKNHVEHECIPPSIRDYKEQVGEQVDIAAKLQEDPLILIKKREEESRRQFLNNPVQMKKLQKALKAQEKLKVKSKKRKHHDSNLDDKLVKKLLKLKSSGTIPDLPKKVKKSKEDKHLDTIITHKYNELKSHLSESDLKDIFAGKVESSDSSNSDDSDEEKNSDDYNSDDGKQKYKRKIQEGKNRPNWNPKRDFNNSYRDKGDWRQNREYAQTSKAESSRTNSKPSTSVRNYKETERHREDVSSKSKKHKRYSNSEESNSEDERKKRHQPRSKVPEKISKERRRPSTDSESSNHERNFKKSWGLVKADGTQIPLKRTEHKRDKPHTKTVEIKQSDHKKRTKLSQEEKEKKLNEMMANAKWRDREREQNVSKYRESELKEETSRKDYNPDFIKKELWKSANSSTVESRIKSKVNNIQRSGSDMNKHFSRRH